MAMTSYLLRANPCFLLCPHVARGGGWWLWCWAGRGGGEWDENCYLIANRTRRAPSELRPVINIPYFNVFFSFFSLQLYELTDDAKRRAFLDDLFSFMQKRGGQFLHTKKCQNLKISQRKKSKSISLKKKLHKDTLSKGRIVINRYASNFVNRGKRRTHSHCKRER